MSSAYIAMRHVDSSNLPAREKGLVRKQIEDALVGNPRAHKAYLQERNHKTYSKAVTRGAMQTAVSGAMGAVLGLVHAHKGLDVGKNKNIPVDGLAGVALFAAAILSAESDASEILMDGAAFSIGLAAFRLADKRGQQMMAQKGQLPASALSTSSVPAAAVHPTVAKAFGAPAAAPPASSSVGAESFGADPVSAAERLSKLAVSRLP